jgi:glutamine amidotransferase
VHSYYVQVEDEALTAGVSRYPFPFTCAVARNNIFAVQFHPEKSQTAGLQLLSNFVQWDGVFSANSVAALGTADA